METSSQVKGFKCFDMDLKCRGFQFEIGKTYEHPGEVQMCANGFHFHENFEDHNNYYSDSRKRVCEVVASDVITDKDKSVCKIIRIERELGWREFSSDYGYGSGYGSGSGSGDGYGYGYGSGSGDGYGDGSGDGSGEQCPEVSFKD